jgi:hypothetical protein
MMSSRHVGRLIAEVIRQLVMPAQPDRGVPGWHRAVEERRAPHTRRQAPALVSGSGGAEHDGEATTGMLGCLGVPWTRHDCLCRPAGV